jgi:hypothetical protein
MSKLTFLLKEDGKPNLNGEQLEYARIIGEKAIEMGVPPKLAIAIAYHESKLNPNVKRGAAGEYGIMQVMPKTGKGMGFSNQDLADPEKNIEAGLKYLKQNLDAFGGDQKLATIGYNAGTDSEFFSNGPMPKSTENYLKAINGYGAYSAEEVGPEAEGAPKAETAAPASTVDPVETDAQRDARIQGDIDAQEKRQAQLYGGAAGLGMSVTKAAGSGAGAALQGAANRVGQGFRAGMQGNVPAAPAAAPMQGGLGVPEPNANQSTRILQGTTGDEGTTGRARQQGYNEQTAQQAAQRKEMDKLLSQLKSTGAVANDAPAVFAQNPGMTSTPSGVVYPRSEPAQTLGPRGPEGQVGFTKPPPPPPPSMLSRASSGLDYVGNLFTSMMRPIETIARHAGPPLALAGAAGSGVGIAQQFRKPSDQRDYLGMGLDAANIVGSGMMFTPAAPLGGAIAGGAAAAQEYRSDPQYYDKKINQLGRALYPNMGKPDAGQYFDPMTGLPQ